MSEGPVPFLGKMEQLVDLKLQETDMMVYLPDETYPDFTVKVPFSVAQGFKKVHELWSEWQDVVSRYANHKREHKELYGE